MTSSEEQYLHRKCQSARHALKSQHTEVLPEVLFELTVQCAALGVPPAGTMSLAAASNSLLGSGSLTSSQLHVGLPRKLQAALGFLSHTANDDSGTCTSHWLEEALSSSKAFKKNLWPHLLAFIHRGLSNTRSEV